MKILHSVAPAQFGGLEEVVLRLSTGLRRRGHEVIVASVREERDAPHAFDDALRTDGVRVSPIHAPGRRYLHEISQLRELFGRVRPDLLHTHGYRPDVIHPFAARAFGIPLVSTLHGFTGGGWRNRAYEWLQIRSVTTFDQAVCVSRTIAGHLRRQGVPERAVRVIPNAWEARSELLSPEAARAELGVPVDRFHIGWIGRLSHEKAPGLLMSAVPKLLSTCPDPVVSFVGDGPLFDELEAAAAKGPVDVCLHGMIPGAARLLPAFDILVLSSRTEGTPIVLFEAMAAGVPVVATSVGGVPDVVDEQTARLVPPEDPTALAFAISEVRRDPASARSRAEAARARLDRRYALEPWIQAYEAVYTSVLDARGP